MKLRAWFLAVGLVLCASPRSSARAVDGRAVDKDASVIILGGGVAGVIAARTLYEKGIRNITIVEARGELGGRLMSTDFGLPGKNHTLELGANWIQGTQITSGPKINPIYNLTLHHDLQTRPSDFDGNISTFSAIGQDDFRDVLKRAEEAYKNLTIAAGARVNHSLVDLTARAGLSLVGAKSRTPQAMASEYYTFDWEYAQSPEQSSMIATSWGNNFTYVTGPPFNGFGEGNRLSVDKRGFKYFLQEEAKGFLKESPGPKQPRLRLNATVKSITYPAASAPSKAVQVLLTNGETLHADYVLCTLSLGVLQHDDVVFKPALPSWKQEAIQSMAMGTYTKIFLQFEKKFWFDTEMALYADPVRGRYPVWQSLDHPKFFPGSGIIFATVTGDFSLRVEALSDTQVQEEVLGVLRTMYPGRPLPQLLAFRFHRWNADPLFRGSYSNWPPSFFSEHHANVRANVGERLWFAGEATSQKYFGFLHGAYFEGLDVATDMANCIKGGGCLGMKHFQDVKNGMPYNISQRA